MARSLVAAEPTREESHASLVRLYALAGRRGDALRQYDYLVEVLDQELGVEPSAPVQRLREEVDSRRAEEPKLTAELWERAGDLRALSGDGVGACRDPTCSALLNPVATEAFATLGDPENAGFYSRAAGRVAESFSSSAWKAMADTSAGSVAKVQGDEPAARGHFELACDLYKRAGQPFWSARSARLAAAR